MKVTKRQLKRMIMEMLDVDHPSDVETVENVWSGDAEAKDRNLALFIDHPTVSGGEATTREPEMMPRQENMVSESQLRTIVKRILKEEAADCESDYRAGGLSWEEYQDCLERFSEEEYYSPGSKAKKDPYGWGDWGRGYGRRRRRSYYR